MNTAQIMASDATAGAKLAAIAIEMGAKSARDVAEALNIKLRTAERHYADARILLRNIAGDTQNCASAELRTGTQNCVDTTQNCVIDDTQNCVAAKESFPHTPFKENNYNTADRKLGESESVTGLHQAGDQPDDEIPGLNGSTPRLVGWLAGWLSPFSPDLETARDILASNVELYGPEKVHAGMLDLRTQIAAGKKPTNLAKSFTGFVRNANPAPKSTGPTAGMIGDLKLNPDIPLNAEPVLDEWDLENLEAANAH